LFKRKINDLNLRLAWVYKIPLSLPENSVHVDLGSGGKPRNPFLASHLIATDHNDLFSNPLSMEFRKQDLTKPLKFADNSIDSFSAYDVLEHVPRWERLPDGQIIFPFVNLMSEIFRCLKPGGIFLALTPSFPSGAAFQDPTHINFISRDTVNYFAGPAYSKVLMYGFNASFEIVYENWAWAGYRPLPEHLLEVEESLMGEGIKNKLLKAVRKNAIIYVPLLWIKLSLTHRKESSH
jgi:SAM-dependent methyltransferase